MSVADGTVTSGSVTGGANKTLASVVVDAGHNAMLVVIHEPSGGFPSDTTAVSWGGVNFTRVASVSDSNAQSIDTWFGIGLTPGTGSLTFSSNHSSTKRLVCISYGNVDAVTPTGAASTVGSTTNLNNAAVATTAGGYVVGCGQAEANAGTVAAFTAQNGQTQLFDDVFGTATLRLHVGKQTASGTSTQDRYTLSPAASGTLVSFQINAASGTALAGTIRSSGKRQKGATVNFQDHDPFVKVVFLPAV